MLYEFEFAFQIVLCYSVGQNSNHDKPLWNQDGLTPKPEAQVARFLVGMFRNRFLEAGVNAKVSPKVTKCRSRRKSVSKSHQK
jgi:hypothetical protein